MIAILQLCAGPNLIFPTPIFFIFHTSQDWKYSIVPKWGCHKNQCNLLLQLVNCYIKDLLSLLESTSPHCDRLKWAISRRSAVAVRRTLSLWKKEKPNDSRSDFLACMCVQNKGCVIWQKNNNFRIFRQSWLGQNLGIIDFYQNNHFQKWFVSVKKLVSSTKIFYWITQCLGKGRSSDLDDIRYGDGSIGLHEHMDSRFFFKIWPFYRGPKLEFLKNCKICIRKISQLLLVRFWRFEFQNSPDDRCLIYAHCHFYLCLRSRWPFSGILFLIEF